MIETKLPLSPDIMVEYFKDKDQYFNIDYKETLKSMSPKSILIYLSNLQIKCDFIDIDLELIEEYIKLRDTCNIIELDVFLADCLYFMKYGESFMNSKLFDEYGQSVISDNYELLSHYRDIMDSSTLFLYSNVDELKEDLDIQEQEIYGSPIGFCFLNLYKIPDFLISFLKEIKPLSEQKYFTDYFDNDNYMFKGQNLFKYFSHENNLLLSYMITLHNSILDRSVDDIKRLIEVHEQL